MEKNIDCGIREFKEETGLTNDMFHILQNINPLIEVFKGTNGILYKHIYYFRYHSNGLHQN